MFEQIIIKNKKLIDKLYKIIEEKNELIFKQRQEVNYLKYKNECLRIENRRLKND